MISNDPTAEYFVPTQEWVAGLNVGDEAPNCFGEMSRVVEVTDRGIANGSAFVMVWLAFTESSAITNSFRAGELHRTVPLIMAHTSQELDDIEKGATM